MYSKLVCGLALTVGAAHGAAHNLVRRDGAHGHHGAGAAAPASGYEQPAQDAGYAAPAVSYGYDEPAADSGYGATSGYGEEGGFDIATLLIPILILAGLSLLFPTITTVDVNSDRRKRHAVGDVNPMTEVVGRVNDIYSAVVQSEECMERIACEVGGLAADVGLTQSPAIKLAGGFVPSKYKNYYKQFASGKDCQKIKCGTFA